MKKGLAICALFVLCLGLTSPAAAQKTRKTKSFETKPVHRVSLVGAGAFSDGKGVWLRWQTGIEKQNLGFNIYRVEGDRTTQANPHLIGGAFMAERDESPRARDYTFFDPAGGLETSYYIESFGLGLERLKFDIFAPQYVPDLTEIAGVSSSVLRQAAAEADPVVFNNELSLPKDLTDEVNVNRLTADNTVQKWIAAQPGVKIGVKKTGFYRVSRAELQAAGFDVSAATDLWQLYTDGVEQSITIGPNGDYIEFYGRGLNTLYSNVRTYFLLVGAQNGKRINSIVRRPIGGTVISPNYNQTFSKEERFFYSFNFLNGETENFFGSIINTQGVNINFDLTGIDFSVPRTTIDIALQGLTNNPHQTQLVLNGETLGTVAGTGMTSMSARFNVNTALLREGSNTLNAKALNPSGDISLFDSIKINFARQFKADQNQLAFYTANYRAAKLHGFTSPAIRVFDTTRPDTPVEISNLNVRQSGAEYLADVPAHRGRVMFAATNEAMLQAESLVANSPSALSTPAHNADLVIITYKDFLGEANNWANYRRGDGLRVEVVNIEDIFDEFNFGRPGADPVQNFLQYAKLNWQTPPRYTLLIGDATYDPKNYTAAGNFNFVPTRITDTIYIETGSDDALADFNNDGLAEMPVGRIPARTPQEVANVLGKVVNFEQSVTNSFMRGSLCVSDLPNGYDFEGLCNRVLGELPANYPKATLNRGMVDARANLLNQLDSGKYIVNYSGHGTTGSWASNDFYSSTDVAQLNNTNKLSVFVMLTCLNGYFINPFFSGLSETLLNKTNTGAVAAWSSTGLTTPDIQEIMARRFYRQLGTGTMNRLGDLINDSKTTIGGGRDVRLSWVLLGDPTLKVK